MTSTMSNATVAEGDFQSLKMDDWNREMLEDAYKAVTKANRWDFLRRTDVPGPNGFMFSDWPQMKDIDTFMEYGGHSGASYGCVMREMEYIAKRGWDAFALKYGRKNPPAPNPTPAAAATTFATTVTATKAVDNFLATNPPTNDLAAFADAIQSNPGMRATIPDIDDQAAALKRFAEGKMSYAEMRSLCG